MNEVEKTFILLGWEIDQKVESKINRAKRAVLY